MQFSPFLYTISYHFQCSLAIPFLGEKFGLSRHIRCLVLIYTAKLVWLVSSDPLLFLAKPLVFQGVQIDGNRVVIKLTLQPEREHSECCFQSIGALSFYSVFFL